ncbi:tRNA(Met) cytidine acetyltransferase TmcA [Thiolapillus sp.]
MSISQQGPSFYQQWRNFLIISGDVDSCHRQAMAILAGEQALWISNSPLDGVNALPTEKITGLLGQDVDHLVFDALGVFDADAFAIASGLVRGGGYFLLLTPPLGAWPEQHGLESGAAESANSSHFIRRLAHVCSKYQPSGSTCRIPGSATEEIVATREQQLVIAALETVAHGHRKRPLVVIADRGRGKSSAFGMAAAKLLAENGKRILVTAPRRNASLALFRHAASALPAARRRRGLLEYGDSRLQFVAPDELLQKRPAADLLLVDEAAGIPVPLLEKLLLQYKRVAFTTTVHGYEGSGKGFSLRFARVLDKHCSQWKQLHLQEPVRWAQGDPLEDFTFRALLLDAEPAAVADDLEVDKLVVRQLPREDLVHDEPLLRQLFGLLINAHYRTTPTDLRHLLDAPNLRLWLGSISGQPVAAMLVATEGQLPTGLHQQIMAGKRRPAGHFLPLALATQCGFPEALHLCCERVVRIAVHPSLQQRGIGSRMLETLLGSATGRGVDLLGSSFGATPELVAFWRKKGFLPVRLGYRREASSGAHSVLMLQGLQPRARDLQSSSRRQFLDQFSLQLAEVFSDLEPELARVLGQEGRAEKAMLSAVDCQSLHAFSTGGRQYLDSLGALHRLALHQLECGAEDSDIFIIKLLQKRSWQSTAAVLGLSGKKATLECLRQRVNAFLHS